MLSYVRNLFRRSRTTRPWISPRRFEVENLEDRTVPSATGIGGHARAATLSSFSNGRFTRTSAAFFRQALAGIELDASLGAVAVARSSTPIVREFGQILQADAAGTLVELGRLLQVPGTLSTAGFTSTDQGTLNTLSTQTGSTFDRTFLNDVASAETRLQNLYQTENQSTGGGRTDQAGRNFAAGQVQVARNDLALANRLLQASQNGTLTGATLLGGTPVSQADAAFAVMAAEDNEMEIMIGSLALSHGGSASVRNYGRMLLTDHLYAQRELLPVLTQLGITYNGEVSTDNQTELTKLAGLSGAAFDSEFLSHNVTDHQKDIPEYSMEGMTAQNLQIAIYAEAQVPTLTKHLYFAQYVQQGGRFGDQTGGSDLTGFFNGTSSSRSSRR